MIFGNATTGTPCTGGSHSVRQRQPWQRSEPLPHKGHRGIVGLSASILQLLSILLTECTIIVRWAGRRFFYTLAGIQPYAEAWWKHVHYLTRDTQFVIPSVNDRNALVATVRLTFAPELTSTVSLPVLSCFVLWNIASVTWHQ